MQRFYFTLFPHTFSVWFTRHIPFCYTILYFLIHTARYGSSRLVQNNIIHFQGSVAGPRERCDLLAISRAAAVVLTAAVVFTAAVVRCRCCWVRYHCCGSQTIAVVLKPLLWFLILLMGSVPLLSCLVP